MSTSKEWEAQAKYHREWAVKLTTETQSAANRAAADYCMDRAVKERKREARWQHPTTREQIEQRIEYLIGNAPGAAGRCELALLVDYLERHPELG